jgi:pyruvate,orthophosphate dikinase
MTTTLNINTTIVLHSIHNPTIELYLMHQSQGGKLVADNKFVYFFGGNKTEGKNSMKDLLGGKGCVQYLKQNKYPEGLLQQVDAAIVKLEEVVGKKFGDDNNPLLVSVRSGARVSMPGMMDTVLNLGMNDRSVLGLARNTDNPRFAYDSYRRFLTMFGDVVLGIEHDKFEHALSDKKPALGVKQDTELDVNALKELVEQFKLIIEKETGEKFPQDARKQLMMAIEAVFQSWNNQRAITYRKLNNIPMDWGTAVNVQAMVYGNMGETSGTGVAFTRDPGTGEKRFFGEYLINAQGEDVVAGIRTPNPSPH